MYELTTDPSFNRNNTEEYKLSIQVSLDGFSFSMIDEVNNRLLVLGRNPATISSASFLGRRFSEWYDNNELMHQQYKESRLICYTEKFTLVPDEIFIESKKNEIVKFIFGDINGYEVKVNFLPGTGSHLLFAIPESLINAVATHLKEPEILHPLLNLDREIQKKLNPGENTLLIYFCQNSFILTLYSDQKLLLSNSFVYYHANDVAYYIISVLRQLEIDLSETTIFSGGKIQRESELYKNLTKYFDLEFLMPEINFNPDIFNKYLHTHITLF